MAGAAWRAMLALAGLATLWGAPAGAAPRKITNVPFHALTIVAEPSLARRVMAVRGLDLPSGGVTVPLDCYIIRAEPGLGGLLRLNCGPADPKTPRDLVDGAITLSAGYVVKTPSTVSMLDILTTRMLVRLAPAPPIDLARGDREPVAPALLDVARRPSVQDMQLNFPEEGMRTGVGGIVRLTCLILDDLSLACPEVEVVPPTPASFVLPAQRLSLYFRSADKLKDGAPAAGHWIKIPIHYHYSGG